MIKKTSQSLINRTQHYCKHCCKRLPDYHDVELCLKCEELILDVILESVDE